MARMSRATKVFGYRPLVEKRAWRADGYTDLSEASVRDLPTIDFHLALTGRPMPEETGFEIPTGKRAQVPGLPGGEFIIVHPGTARPEKYWPAESWAEVISRLPLPVVLTGARDADERAHLAAIRGALSPSCPSVHDLSGTLTLLQLAAAIARARLVLSVDSAAMHLAAMARRPQVALFGPTNPFHWAPRHPDARVLLASGEPAETVGPRHTAAAMHALSTAAVLAAIDALLGRSPSPASARPHHG
jgi:ADP-heptose:LPS heptosyltransferase